MRSRRRWPARAPKQSILRRNHLPRERVRSGSISMVIRARFPVELAGCRDARAAVRGADGRISKTGAGDGRRDRRQRLSSRQRGTAGTSGQAATADNLFTLRPTPRTVPRQWGAPGRRWQWRLGTDGRGADDRLVTNTSLASTHTTLASASSLWQAAGTRWPSRSTVLLDNSRDPKLGGPPVRARFRWG